MLAADTGAHKLAQGAVGQWRGWEIVRFGKLRRGVLVVTQMTVGGEIVLLRANQHEQKPGERLPHAGTAERRSSFCKMVFSMHRIDKSGLSYCCCP